MSEIPELAPNAVFTGHDLSGADFAERDLTGARFSDCTLVDVILSAVILEGASFASCRFIRCRFAHADLREATFDKCSFADPDSHSGVEIAFSQLDSAVFKTCDLSFADIDRTSLYAVAFESCNLRGARFHRADFARSFGRNVVRSAAAFTACNLELADLSDARLAGCDLKASSFREADLTGANLDGADLTHCDFGQALTTGARMAGADIRGSNVAGLLLTGLAAYEDLKVTLDQQQDLLTALGLDVRAD